MWLMNPEMSIAPFSALSDCTSPQQVDYDTAEETVYSDGSDEAIAKGGVACPFPWKLHDMLDAVVEEGLDHIVSWQPHGRAFTVYKPQDFVDKIMPRFFGQTKYPSFQRQLNLYGFSRFAHGRDKGAYYHSCFIRGNRSAVRGMVRRKIKGTKVRRTMSPAEEPDFYVSDFAGRASPVHSNIDCTYTPAPKTLIPESAPSPRTVVSCDMFIQTEPQFELVGPADIESDFEHEVFSDPIVEESLKSFDAANLPLVDPFGDYFIPFEITTYRNFAGRSM